jgi:hypothetical protein
MNPLVHAKHTGRGTRTRGRLEQSVSGELLCFQGQRDLPSERAARANPFLKSRIQNKGCFEEWRVLYTVDKTNDRPKQSNNELVVTDPAS